MTITEKDVSLAREGVLAINAQHGNPQLFLGANSSIPLPAPAVSALVETLQHLANGHGVAVQPLTEEISTQEAANLLFVSRPFMVKLLEEGKIPFRKVGAHRRVRREDVAAYKRQIDEARHRVLDELQAQAQELGMGY